MIQNDLTVSNATLICTKPRASVTQYLGPIQKNPHHPGKFEIVIGRVFPKHSIFRGVWYVYTTFFVNLITFVVFLINAVKMSMEVFGMRILYN